jgi:hypothetical protein
VRQLEAVIFTWSFNYLTSIAFVSGILISLDLQIAAARLVLDFDSMAIAVLYKMYRLMSSFLFQPPSHSCQTRDHKIWSRMLFNGHQEKW